MAIARSTVLRVVKILVSTTLLLAIVVSIARTEGIEELPARLGEVDPWAWLLAAGLQSGSVLIGVERWRRLLRWQSIDLAYGRLLRIYLVGRFVGAFTPGTTGLDVVRAVEVARETGETAKSTVVIVVEKVFGILGLALCAVATLPFGADRFFGASAYSVSILAALGSLALAWLVMHPVRLAVFARPLPAGPRAKLENVVERLSSTPPRFAEVVHLGVLAMVSHSFTAACYAASGLSLRVDATLGELIVVGYAIVVAMIVPISAGGAGVREGTAVLLLRAIDVPASDAVLVAVLGYLATQPPAVVGGLVQMFERRRAPARDGASGT